MTQNMSKPLRTMVTTGPVQHLTLSSTEEELAVVLAEKISIYRVGDLIHV
jgi:hypothetical protein